jgi:thiol-disulfide isomerase/thioredoxin
MTIEKRGSAGPRNSPALVLSVGALSALLGFAAVYGTGGGPDNGEALREPSNLKVNSQVDAPAAAGLSQGAMTAFVFKKTPEELPDVSFVDAAGTPRTLKELKGKALLLNLWATWCAPCREEMPSLDRLEKELGSDRFEVVALAVDRGGLDAARKFLSEINVERLKLYADPTTRSGPALRVVGMPTTILIDRQGREIGRLPGPADWSSPEAKRLVEAALR